MTATPGIDDRVNKTLGTTVELKITLQVAYFIEQILFLAYGGSSIVKTLKLNLFSHVVMVRSEVEISASVGGFSINLSSQCRPFPDDQNIPEKGSHCLTLFP
jgi:hypothetical protein